MLFHFQTCIGASWLDDLASRAIDIEQLYKLSTNEKKEIFGVFTTKI